MPRGCANLESYRQLALGVAPDDVAADLEEHLLECPACVQTVRGLTTEDEWAATLHSCIPRRSSTDQEHVERLIERLLADLPSSLPESSATLGDRGPTADTPVDVTQEVYGFLRPAEAPGEIGRIGSYRILKVLGVGGMGVVFLAEDTQLQRHVALKTMKSSLAADPKARDRFLREARAAAALAHDHIVTIHQVGEDAGVPYLAMQLLLGESLDDRLRRDGKLPASEVVRIGREIALGLAAAHQRGLIHRDIKPGNIWLESERDRVKILDFGLARAIDDSVIAAKSERTDIPFSRDIELTHFGSIVGTPAYMAPEQARGEALDARSDLYSLGCVLYHMLTGRTPFGDRNHASTLVALENAEPIQPRRLNRFIPRSLDRLVLRLLAKHPADRPTSAAELARTLASEATRLTRGRRLTIAMAAAVLFATAMGTLKFYASPNDKSKRSAESVSIRSPTSPFRASHFSLQKRYRVGRSPYSVVVADFNGDGRPDLAVTNEDDNSISLLRGKQDGTFFLSVPLATGAGPLGIVACDFNGDGKVDLAIACGKANALAIHLGNGDGTFRSPTTIAVKAEPRGLVAADFNGDGRLDLAVTCAADAKTLVHLGNGDGTFRRIGDFDTPGGPRAVAAGDLNGDGTTDLVISCGGNDSLWVALGNGNGTFQSPNRHQVGSGPGPVVLGDFNNDGKLDVAVANFGSNDLSILLGRGNGDLQPASSQVAGMGPGGLHLAMGDFNGDGCVDLVVANHNSADISLFAGNGDGTFRSAESFAAGWTPADVAVGDFTGNGGNDIVVVNHRSSDVSILLRRPPEPSFRLTYPQFGKVGIPYSLTVTALDADKAMDTDYPGRCHCTCTDSRAEIGPSDQSQRPIRGIFTFSAILRTAGAQLITVSDPENPKRQGSIMAMVLPGTANRFVVEAPPRAIVGKPVRVRVFPVDEFDNLTDDFRGKAKFNSSDTHAKFPGDQSFLKENNYAATCSIEFQSPGTHSLVIKDTGAGAIVGNVKILVVPAAVDGSRGAEVARPQHN